MIRPAISFCKKAKKNILAVLEYVLLILEMIGQAESILNILLIILYNDQVCILLAEQSTNGQNVST